MDNLIEKLTNSKSAMLLGLGGAALAGLVGYLYHQYNNQNPQQEQQNLCSGQFNLQNQLEKFKAKNLPNNLNLETVKEMLQFSFSTTQRQLKKITNDFKITRRAINRNQNIKEYLKTVAVGIIRIRQVASTLQQAIMTDIGLTPQVFGPYQMQLRQFLYELQMNLALGSKQITLGQARNSINTQLDFVKEHGEQLVDKIIQNCKDWQIQAKKFIPQLFTVYLADEMYLDHPQLQELDMKGVQKRFEKYLQNQTLRMRGQMQPLITRLCADVGLYQPQNQNLQVSENLNEDNLEQNKQENAE